MAHQLTAAERKAREDHFHEHPDCWMCMCLAHKQQDKTELHHISGRGRHHHCRENYASLCSRHHRLLQSRRSAEVICLMLKHRYDEQHYNPEKVCELRGRSVNNWTHHDTLQCRDIMQITMEALR
jgi:hypothetical protein